MGGLKAEKEPEQAAENSSSVLRSDAEQWQRWKRLFILACVISHTGGGRHSSPQAEALAELDTNDTNTHTHTGMNERSKGIGS